MQGYYTVSKLLWNEWEEPLLSYYHGCSTKEILAIGMFPLRACSIYNKRHGPTLIKIEQYFAKRKKSCPSWIPTLLKQDLLWWMKISTEEPLGIELAFSKKNLSYNPNITLHVQITDTTITTNRQQCQYITLWLAQ